MKTLKVGDEVYTRLPEAGGGNCSPIRDDLCIRTDVIKQALGVSILSVTSIL